MPLLHNGLHGDHSAERALSATLSVLNLVPQ